MKVVYAPRARHDLLDIEEFRSQSDPESANLFVSNLIDRIGKLNPLPYGKPADLPAVEVLVISDLNYYVYYSVDGGKKINILHIRHTSQTGVRPEDLF